MDRQLFILDDRVWDSMSFDDVKSTIEDMSELDIAYPPCRYFDVMTKGDVVDRIISLSSEIELKNKEIRKNYPTKWQFNFDENLDDYSADILVSFEQNGKWISFLHHSKNKNDFEENLEWINYISSWVMSYLIVALAAKNSVKTVKQNKLAKLGIGKKKEKYAYTTTVTIGEITETEGTGEGGGWKVRPHLRRGHIREQRFGPNRQYSKKVFIQPIFVNASEDFINSRRAYNVKVA